MQRERRAGDKRGGEGYTKAVCQIINRSHCTDLSVGRAYQLVY